MVLGGDAEDAAVQNSSCVRASPNGTNAASDPMAMRCQGLKGELQKAEERVSSCSQQVEVSWEQSAKRLSCMESGLDFLTDRLAILNNQVQTMTDSSASNTSGVEIALPSDAKPLVMAGAFEQLEQHLSLLRTQLNQRMEDLTNRVDELAQHRFEDKRRFDSLQEQVFAHSQRFERLRVAQSCQDITANCGTFETVDSSKETLASLPSRVDRLEKLLSTERQLREASISRLELQCRPASNLESCEPEGPAAATPAPNHVATHSSQCAELRQGHSSASRVSPHPHASGPQFRGAVTAGIASGGDAPDDAAAQSDTARAHAAVPPPDDQLDRTMEAVVVPVTLLPAPSSKNSVPSSHAPKPSKTSLTFTSRPTLSPTNGSEVWPLSLSQQAFTARTGSPPRTTVTPLLASPDRLKTNVRVIRSSSVPQLTPPVSQLSTSRFPQPPSVGSRDDDPVRNERRRLYEMAQEPFSSPVMISRRRTLSGTHGRGATGGQRLGCQLASTNSPPPPHSSWSASSQGVQFLPGSTTLPHATAKALTLTPDTTAAAASPSPVRSSRHSGTGIMHRSLSSPSPICPTPVPALPGPSAAAGF